MASRVLYTVSSCPGRVVAEGFNRSMHQTRSDLASKKQRWAGKKKLFLRNSVSETAGVLGHFEIANEALRAFS